jgi:hypothetical protein
VVSIPARRMTQRVTVNMEPELEAALIRWARAESFRSPLRPDARSICLLSTSGSTRRKPMPNDDVLMYRHQQLLAAKLQREKEYADDANRDFWESLREEDYAAADTARDRYKAHAREMLDLKQELGSQQQNQQNDGLLDSERQWLLANPDYVRNAEKAQQVNGYAAALIGAGVRRGSPEYMEAINNKFGSGDNPLPSHAEVAKICGISLEDYERQRQVLETRKAAGLYREGQH